jgi:hypothetical protein
MRDAHDSRERKVYVREIDHNLRKVSNALVECRLYLTLTPDQANGWPRPALRGEYELSKGRNRRVCQCLRGALTVSTGGAGRWVDDWSNEAARGEYSRHKFCFNSIQAVKKLHLPKRPVCDWGKNCHIPFIFLMEEAAKADG